MDHRSATAARMSVSYQKVLNAHQLMGSAVTIVAKSSGRDQFVEKNKTTATWQSTATGSRSFALEMTSNTLVPHVLAVLVTAMDPSVATRTLSAEKCLACRRSPAQSV